MMKNHTNKFVSLAFVAAIIFTFFVVSQAQTKNMKQPNWDYRDHQTEIIDYVKKYLVSDLEKGLPSMSYADWFQKIVGAERKVKWGLAECPMQEITTESGIALDLQMCVDSSIPISRKTFLHVYIECGTFTKGISEGKPIVRSIFTSDKNGNALATVEILHELPKFLYAIRNSIAYFNPNNGEFEIAGKKPPGFEDFSTIWFRSVDYDSNDHPFALKNYGDAEAGRKHYELRNVFFDGRSWSFETKVIGGVSYKFNGKFAKTIARRYGTGDVDNNALHGHLTKFVKGKKAAEADLFFNFYETGDAG